MYVVLLVHCESFSNNLMNIFILVLNPSFIYPIKTINYRIARKFRGVKFSWKLIRLSFHDFIFADSNPIAIINDVKFSFAD